MAERQTVLTLAEVRADHRARYEWAADLVEGDIVDAGCGVGYGANTMALRTDVCSVFAVDNSAEAIDFASRHWGHAKITWGCFDAVEIAEPVDWVVCFEMLEHVQQPKMERMLREFAGISHNLLCSVPNETALPFDPQRFPYHCRHYTAAEMHQILHDNGWEVTEEHGQLTAHSGLTPAWSDPGVLSRSRTLVFRCAAL